jgi:hypothetical protein
VERLTEAISGGAMVRSGGRDSGRRFLVYVHGICSHPVGFSDDWWRALRPHTIAFGEGRRGDTRREVRWSDLVNARDLRGIDAGEQAALRSLIQGALEERAAIQVAETAPTILSPEVPRDLFGAEAAAERGLFDIPGFNCIDDFTRYMLDSSIRQQVMGRFTEVVGPLLAEGAEVDVISHSWGTIVAYEGLRTLEETGVTNAPVANFFTVGAALAIFVVKRFLQGVGRGDGRKPSMVRQWINLNAHGDPIGGRLQGQPYQVDAEFLNLSSLDCGFLELSCAHNSYFRPGNLRVNRDIFAAFINRAG